MKRETMFLYGTHIYIYIDIDITFSSNNTHLRQFLSEPNMFKLYKMIENVIK